MFDKKKINFWRLSFIFTIIVVLILILLWSSPQESKATMMNSSMGNMMNSMHLSNITIYDLINGSENMPQTNDNEQHHTNESTVILNLNFITTALIFFLLPFIIGGAIILAIAWFK